MIKRFGLALMVAFAPMTLVAVSVQPAAAQAAGLTVDSNIPDLLANPAAKAVLERHLGADLVNNPQLASAPISLRALAQYVPTLTEEVLTQINADLAMIQ
jgi:hypothetical protein